MAAIKTIIFLLLISFPVETYPNPESKKTKIETRPKEGIHYLTISLFQQEIHYLSKKSFIGLIFI